MMIKKCYSELSKLKTFEERFEYLSLNGEVGNETFGWERYLNQVFYKSPEWLNARDEVIVRDNGCDLGIYGLDINNKIIVHHMNPITIEQIESNDPDLYNPEYLISTAFKTHNGIHYGSLSTVQDTVVIDRKPNDTKIW